MRQGEPLCTRVVYRHRRCRERGTCDRDRLGYQEVLSVVGVSRLVRACLVQVTVVLSRIVRVPFTHKVLVFHALAAARVESACRALAAGAYFHILVVGRRAPNRTPFVPKPAGPNRDGGPNSAAPSVGAATTALVLVARCGTTARLIASFDCTIRARCRACDCKPQWILEHIQHARVERMTNTRTGRGCVWPLLSTVHVPSAGCVPAVDCKSCRFADQVSVPSAGRIP